MRNSKAGKIAEITCLCETYEMPVPEGMANMSFIELKKLLSDSYKNLLKLSKEAEAK